MKKLLTAAATIALISTSSAAAPPGRDCGALPDASMIGEAHAIDGDTLAVLRADGTRWPDVRLWGIQAPELRDARSKLENPAGMRSRVALEDLLPGSITCRPIEWDRYCRVVARCATDATPDLSLTMLSAGEAYLFTTFAMGRNASLEIRTAYVAAERQARADRRGLWRAWLAP
ncbi:thermonuclease family protein [Vineibacter terrae]|uniref:Thermonuclease family protein n=1 Tax=Vineibacter terrae TaxID=2586908 RepID=A0A5C8PGX3_9HYPH|nr:thermonuclease family protein [Vineibacter terrae]TXL72544.1 thermonuclease family protein [Vineibacter terrae]